MKANFPSFSEGLSLRCSAGCVTDGHPAVFPFLFGGAFIEALIRAFLRTTRQCISLLSVGTFIEALRRAHPCLRRKHLNLPYGFVGTFPNLFLLRSWTRHSPGTELFLFAAQEATRLKHRPQTPLTSCHPPPPHIQAENSTRRNSVINSLISQNTPPQC